MASSGEQIYLFVRPRSNNSDVPGAVELCQATVARMTQVGGELFKNVNGIRQWTHAQDARAATGLRGIYKSTRFLLIFETIRLDFADFEPGLFHAPSSAGFQQLCSAIRARGRSGSSQ